MPKVKNPDTYIHLGIGEPETLDPHYAYDTASGEALGMVYDNLIAYKGESVTEFIPRLSLEVPSVENGLIKDDGKTYVFPIRKGQNFTMVTTLPRKMWNIPLSEGFSLTLMPDPCG